MAVSVLLEACAQLGFPAQSRITAWRECAAALPGMNS